MAHKTVQGKSFPHIGKVHSDVEIRLPQLKKQYNVIVNTPAFYDAIVKAIIDAYDAKQNNSTWRPVLIDYESYLSADRVVNLNNANI